MSAWDHGMHELGLNISISWRRRGGLREVAPHAQGHTAVSSRPGFPQCATYTQDQSLSHSFSVPGTVPHGGGSGDNRPDPVLVVYPLWRVQRRNSGCLKLQVCRPSPGAFKAAESPGRAAGAQGRWDQRGHQEVKAFHRKVVRLVEDRCPQLQDQSPRGDARWVEVFTESLAGRPGFPACQPHNERCPWRQDDGEVQGTSFGIGQIWTPTQLQLCVTLDKWLAISEAQFPQPLT